MKSTVNNGSITIFLERRIDTTNSSAVENDIAQITGANQNLVPEFDASSLEYISSAGLRVLLKTAKSFGKKIKVLNVSKDVYDIFETTGFTSILDVHKKLREISVDGCELIGSGSYGKVYRLDRETIAKLYIPSVSLEMVQHERDTAQKAFLLGVPTAISYDVVKSGDCYGAVFELLDAKTVAQIMNCDSSRVQEMGRKSALFLKDLHKIVVDDNTFPKRKDELSEWAERVAPFLESGEADEIRAFINDIPETSTFLHGDFNSKNVMVQGNNFLLIDIGDAAVGHPVFDVAGLILAYIYLPHSPMPDEEKLRLLGFHLEDAQTMLNAMFSAYFNTDSPDEIQKKIQMIMPYANILASYHGCRRANYAPDYIPMIIERSIRTKLLPSIKSRLPLEW
ncbi:MAG: phosphotransferase [Treponema sp.]|nr:phosphotransferase [Treponema sp.]